MEEKERYEYFFGTNTVKDNKTNQFYGCVVDLLNQQDKQIKELQKLIKENQKLKERIIELQDREESYINTMRYLNKTRTELLNTEKALELACETLQDINFKLYNTEMNFVDFFKQQAKEMLENEK